MPILDKYPFKDDVIEGDVKYDIVAADGAIINQDVLINDKTLYLQKGDVLSSKDLNTLCDVIEGMEGGGVLVGETPETAETKTLLLHPRSITEIKADQKNLALFDGRIPSSEIKYGDAGLDEYIDKHIFKTDYDLTDRGMILLKSIDLDTVTLPGAYYCDTCTHVPLDGSWYLDVMTHHNNDGYAVQTIVSVNYGYSFRRSLVGGTWTNWKLIAGEIVLWTGSQTIAGAITLSNSVRYFNHLTLTVASGWTLSADIIDGNVYAMASGSFVQPDNKLTLLSAYLSIKDSGTELTLQYPAISKSLYANDTSICDTVPLTKIVGRP